MRGKNRKTRIKKVVTWALIGTMLLNDSTIVLAQELKEQVVEEVQEYQEEQEYNTQKEKIDEQVIPKQEEVQESEVQQEQEQEVQPGDEIESETETQPTTINYPQVEEGVDKKIKDLDARFGEPIEVTEHERVYQVSETEFITHLTSEPNLIEIEGKETEIDLTLELKKEKTNLLSRMSRAVFYDSSRITEPQYYTPVASEVGIQLPVEVSRESGIRLESEGNVLELFPETGVYGNSTVLENAILYNEVKPGIDVQYTVTKSGLKEDIILKKKVEETNFYYGFSKDKFQAILVGNEIHIYQQNQTEVEEPIFVLSAPVMSDATGVSSDAITLSLEEQEETYRIGVHPEKTWLEDTSRSYPVKIDPTITIPSTSLLQVTTSFVHGRYGGVGYGYAGYITSKMTGVPGAKDIGKSRMYYKINYDFANAIPKEARIDSATFNVYEYIKYPQTTASFASYRIKNSWNFDTLDWTSSLSLGESPTGENALSPAKEGMHRFDIRDAVNGWVQGTYQNHGIVIKAIDETAYGGAFRTPLSSCDASQKPSLTINWSIPDPVDMNYSIDKTTVDLRSFILSTVEGKLQFQGVTADGIATPGATVTYELNDVSKDYKGTTIASYSYKYPDSSDFDSVMPEGTTKYKDKLGNWQTLVPFVGPEFNTLYNISATASKNGVTGKKVTSENFVIYKVTQYDTLPKIANYYGVPLAQIMYDNRVQDMLLVENNTLYIRNPQKNATIPYNPPTLTDDEKAKIDASLMGRGLHCEFGFEPINLNTGNFYLNRKDVSIPELTGDFAVDRFYNSKGASLNSAFGRGWSFAYGEQLSKNSEGDFYYKREDGSILVFEKSGDTYLAPAGYELTFEKTKVGEETVDYGDGNITFPLWGYTITDTLGTVKTFDSYGMLTSITDEKGNKTTLSYDGNQILTKITSPSGTSYEVTMNDIGYVSAIGLPNGATISYAYDSVGNLISMTDAEGGVTRYEYDDMFQMTAWYDPEGTKIIENTYDSEGRVTKQIDPNGSVSTLAYSEKQTITTDGNGNTTTYLYDDQYRTKEIRYPDGTTIENIYNRENQLASTTNKMGQTTTFTYDGNGNELTETRFDGKVKTYTYNAMNKPTKIVGFDGSIVSYTYDKEGNVLTFTLNDMLQATYTVDTYGRVLTSTDANGNETKYSYDGGNLTAITDALGNRTSMEYNSHGLNTKITMPEGQTIIYTYDKEGRKIGVDVSDGIKETYIFDKAGNVTGVTDGNGNTVTFTYDGLGNKIKTDNGSGGIYTYAYDKVGNMTSLTNPEGFTTTYTYDTNNRIITEAEEGEVIATYTYDALGHRLTETDGRGRTTTFTYDEVLGTLETVTDSFGDKVTYAYTDNGLVSKITYPDGTKEIYDYDAWGRTTTFTDQGGKETNYTYDKNGNILTTTDASGTITYTYNGQNKMLSATYPGEATLSYKYDNNGQLAKFTDAMDNETTYESNSTGQVISSTDPFGNVVKNSYDGNGNLAKISDALGNESTTTYSKQNQPEVVTDPLGHTTSYTYNQMEQVETITDALGYVTAYVYNEKGYPIKVTDANGNESTFTYTENGQYDTVTNPDGSQVKYEYNNKGQVVKTTYPTGLIEERSYDVRGRVTKQWDNQGGEEAYTYDTYDNVLTITNALEEVTTFTYNEKQQLVAEELPSGAKTTYTYDVAGNLAETTNPEGIKTSFTYDKNGNVLTKTTQDATWTYTYDVRNQLIKEVDPKGNAVTYEYDILGNPISMTDGNGVKVEMGYDAMNQVIKEVDGNGNTSLLHYDPLGQLAEITHPDLSKESYTYDGNGNILTYTNPLGDVVSYTYDSMNRQVEEKLPNEGIYKYQYNGAGLLETETNPLGVETTYQYDAYGQMTEKELANGAIYTYAYDKLGRITDLTGPEGIQKSYQYDKAGNLASETDQSDRTVAYTYDIMGRMLESKNPLGQVTTFDYDEKGNLTSLLSPMGSETKYTYDILGQLESTLSPMGRLEEYVYDGQGNVTDITVNAERSTTFTYDGNGNETSSTNALGEVTKMTYDSRNQLASILDAAGATTTFTYDAVGQLLEQRESNGSTTTFGYDSLGSLTSLMDGEGRGATYTYDKLGQLTQATVGEGEYINTNTFTYDSVGNLTSATDGNGNTTTYKHNLLGNVTKSENALGEVTAFTYDLNQRLTEVRQPNGRAITYDYNKLDALLTTTYEEEAEGTVLYAYDQDGRRVSMEDLTGTTTYEYDKDGRITGVKQGDGSVILYNYDTYGNLAKLIYPDGKAVSYEYDALDRLTKVTDREGEDTTYTYDKVGNMVEVERGNGTESKLTYDTSGQVLSVTNKDGKNKISSSYTYTYDLSGYIESETIQTKEQTIIKRYGYDKAGQLTEVITTTPDKNGEETILEKVTYGFDQGGNKVSVVTNKDTVTEEIQNTYDAVNRMITSKGSEGETTYLYDANGNQIRKTEPGEKVTEYTYDTENRLLAVTDEKGLLLTALYDGDDNRVFTANRTEDTKEYQLFAPEEIEESKKSPQTSPQKSPQTSPRGAESDIFWYGFGQNFFQAFTLDKDSMGQVWMDIWEDTVSAFHRKILKDRADEEGIVVNPDAIEAGEAITLPGEGEVTYPSESEEVLIPYGVVEETYDYYEVRNYVNDINQSHTQVLMSYDESGEIEETYSYGNERLDYMDYVGGKAEESYTYGYDGFGSVAELTNPSGMVETAYAYSPYGIATTTGNTTTGNPYNYQGEMVDPSTGNQYLRARYYNQSTGTFQTQDSYKGDIREPLTRNLYTYAENNPVTHDDPSGQGIWSSIKKGVSSLAKKVTTSVKSAYTKAKTTVTKVYNTAKTYVSNAYNRAKTYVSKAYNTVKNTVSKAYNKVKTTVTKAYNTVKNYVNHTKEKIVETTQKAITYTKEKAKSAYEKAKELGTSTYNWVASKSREAQNIAKNWTKALEENMKHVCTSVKYAGDKVINTLKDVDWKDIGNKALDGLQTVLDVGGLVPGVGEILDGANALIYLGRGDLVNAGLSAGAMIPFLGWGATGGKLVSKAVKYGDEAFFLGKTALKYTDEAIQAGGKLLNDVGSSANKFLGEAGDKIGGLFKKTAGDGAELVKSGSKNADLNIGSNTTNNMNNLKKLTNGGCFIAGTVIFTDEGKEEIEDIQVGDYVYARDQYGEEQDYKEVTRVFIREKNILIHLKIDGETITTTEEHPFYIEGDGFVQASELEVGDLAETSDGETVPVEAVEVEYLEEPVTVYNFEVEDYHTYYVGDTEVLVHNTCMVGGNTIQVVNNSNINRRQALNQAKDSASIPRSQQPTRQWSIGDDITKKGGSYKNYEYSDNVTHHGRYYEYDTLQGKKIIVDHTNDLEQGLHTHAGEVPKGENILTYDFKNPENRYTPINRDTDHHIRYTDK